MSHLSINRSGPKVLLLLLGLSLPALAEQKNDDRLREQLRSTITQMRALADENASLKSQLAQATAKPAEDPQKTASLEREVRRLRAERDQLHQDLNSQLASGKAAYQEQSEAVLSERREKQALVAQVLNERRSADQSKQVLSQCTAENQALVSISSELLERYQNRGVTDVVLAKEPLTGLRRAQLERLAQNYRIRIGEQTMKASAMPADTNTPTNPASGQ